MTSSNFVLKKEISREPVYTKCSNPYCSGHLLYYLVKFSDGTIYQEYVKPGGEIVKPGGEMKNDLTK